MQNKSKFGCFLAIWGLLLPTVIALGVLGSQWAFSNISSALTILGLLGFIALIATVSGIVLYFEGKKDQKIDSSYEKENSTRGMNDEQQN